MPPVLKLGFCPPLLQFRDAEWSFHFLSKRILNEKHPLLCLLSHETGSPVAACRRSCSLYCSVKSHGEDCGVKRRAATQEKGFYPHVIRPVNRHNSRPLLRLKIVGADTRSPVEKFTTSQPCERWQRKISIVPIHLLGLLGSYLSSLPSRMWSPDRSASWA